MFEVFLSNIALKSLKKLNARTVQKSKKALVSLKSSPIPINEYDIKKIEGAEDTYRLRIGRYRIIYKIDWDRKEIYVLKIDIRDEKTYRL